jgi:sec-independent protein translocase protein TatA
VIGDILQPTHLLFILVIALLVLGPKRLPEVGRSLGRGLRDFRSAISGNEPEPPAPALEAAQNGESQPPQEAAAGSTPVPQPATVSPPAQPTSVPPPAQEPASVSGERGSAGSA